MNQEYTVDPSRLVSPDACSADAEEVSLRPKTLDDYVGQEKAKALARVGDAELGDFTIVASNGVVNSSAVLGNQTDSYSSWHALQKA